MRILIIPTLLACLLTPAANLCAQENPLSTQNKRVYKVMQGMLLRSAEKMPEEHYGFRPAPEVRSFGQLVAHVADAQYAFCSSALETPRSSPKNEETKKTKAEIIAALKEAFLYCDKAYDGMTDEKADDIVKMFGGTPRLGVLSVNNIHNGLHYGNMVTYLRMKNVVPPSSEPDFMKEAAAAK